MVSLRERGENLQGGKVADDANGDGPPAAGARTQRTRNQGNDADPAPHGSQSRDARIGRVAESETLPDGRHPQSISRDEQHLAGGGSALERSVGFRRAPEGKGGPDANPDVTRLHPSENIGRAGE
jgi:hypothetical protein